MRKFNLIILVLVLCCMSGLFVSCGTSESNVVQDGNQNGGQTGVNETNADSNSKENEPIELTAENFEDYFTITIFNTEVNITGSGFFDEYYYTPTLSIQVKPRYSFKCEALTVTLRSGYPFNNAVFDKDTFEPFLGIDEIVLEFTPDGSCEWSKDGTEVPGYSTPTLMSEKMVIVEKSRKQSKTLTKIGLMVYTI